MSQYLYLARVWYADNYVDVDVARSIKGASSKTSAKNAGRVVKRGHGKASTAILFPAFKKQRARKSSESKGVKSSSIL